MKLIIDRFYTLKFLRWIQSINRQSNISITLCNVDFNISIVELQDVDADQLFDIN